MIVESLEFLERGRNLNYKNNDHNIYILMLYITNPKVKAMANDCLT